VPGRRARHRGYHVFPGGANKSPTTPHGLLDASADPEQIDRLWRLSPGELVGIRTDLRNQIRGLLKVFGVVLQRRGGALPFEQQVAEFAAGAGSVLQLSLRTLLTTLKTVREQVEQLDRMAIAHAKESAICRHLMGIPGVGAITAVAFVSAVEDPARFRKSRNVGAYFGLCPKRYQSGETDISGRISRWGDPLVRPYLYEAAASLLVNCKKWSALKGWGMRLAKRRGIKKAIVAVARKLAVIMHQMWMTGEAFRWSNTETVAA